MPTSQGACTAVRKAISLPFLTLLKRARLLLNLAGNESRGCNHSDLALGHNHPFSPSRQSPIAEAFRKELHAFQEHFSLPQHYPERGKCLLTFEIGRGHLYSLPFCACLGTELDAGSLPFCCWEAYMAFAPRELSPCCSFVSARCFWASGPSFTDDCELMQLPIASAC